MNAFSAIFRRGERAIKRRYVARGLILIYHRVAEEAVDPWRLCVSPANFARQVELIRKLGFQPLRVSTLADALRARALPKPTVAITFDDGYSDNFTAARPILEKFDTHATHFATAGYIGSGQPFWWDVLDFIFLRPGRIPEELTLELGGEQHRWSLGRDAVWQSGEGARWPDWKPFRPSPTSRHQIHDALWKLLVGALPDDRQRATQHLIDWASLPPSTWAKMRPMSEDELRELGKDDLVEIGAHSLTHPALSALPPAMQSHELGGSKKRLEQVLGKKVAGCSYPQGRSSPQVQQLAREAGYDFACGSVAGAIGSRANLFHLPRVSVGDWEEARFKALLDHYIVA